MSHSGLKIIPLPKSTFRTTPEMDNLNLKIKKYVSPHIQPSPFSCSDLVSNKVLQKDFDSEIEEKNFIKLKLNRLPNCKSYPKFFTKNRSEDEKSTTIGEMTSRSNFKKTTFSTVEVIRVENYKKYNKIKKKINDNLDWSNCAFDDKECLVF